MGDFNARRTEWNCFFDNSKGRDLIKLCLNLNVTIVTPVMPTHFPKIGKPSVLDFYLIKNIKNNSEALTLDLLNSDHNPVSMSLLGKPVFSKDIEIFDYSNANWHTFRNELNSNISLNVFIKSKEELDLTVKIFNTKILSAIKNNVPLKKISHKNKPTPLIIKKLVKYKNKLRRIWQTNRNTKTKFNFQLMQKVVNIRISKWKNEQWNNLLLNCNPTDNTLWKLKKKISKNKIIIPPLQVNNKDLI